MRNAFLRKRYIFAFIILYVFLFNAIYAVFNMSYLYGNYDYISLVDRTNGAINEVSPSYFDINSDGTLKLNTVDKNLVKNMHERSIKVIPFLSNHWDRELGRKALKSKEKLAKQIINAIKKYNLDGVNVDIENLTEIDKDSYTELIKCIKEKLPSGKFLSVAVSANPNGWNIGWQGSYDYEVIGNLADYVVLMTYDEHYEGSEAGPVAGIEFVEDSIKEALNYISHDKIVLGIPFYGRYWNKDTGLGGYGVVNRKIEEIVSKYSSVVIFDEINKSVRATITINEGDVYPTINGNVLKPGTYYFWYENEKSITEKLKLIKKYDLKGSGIWSLGQETADTWEYYNKVLDADTIEIGEFYDVSKEHWAYASISRIKERGWIVGKNGNTFDPEGALTRAEFATIISRIMEYKFNEKGDFYTDIKMHWARSEINAITMENVMNGYNNGLFMPDKLITREEVAKVLSNYVDGVEGNAEISYLDVTKDRWSYEYINKLSKMGILNGYETGEFKPQNPVKRSEIATLLDRIFGIN